MATFSNSIVLYADGTTFEVMQSASFYDANGFLGRDSVPEVVSSIQEPPLPLSDINYSADGDELIPAIPGTSLTHYRNNRSESFLISKKTENYITDILRGSIYFSPTEMEGFFTGDFDTIISIWNAKFTDVVLNSITVDSVPGTLLVPQYFPHGVGQDTTENHTLTIYADGPPQQETTYKFFFGGVEYNLHIAGIRILPFVFPLNWEKGYKLTLYHDTVIQNNSLAREQRRPLQSRMFKKINVGILIDTITKQDLLSNWAELSQDRILAIPLFQEAMSPTANMVLSETSVIVNETITNYKFLGTATFVLIVDYVTLLGEVKQIATLNTGTKTITFSDGLLNNFNRYSTLIYPVVFSTVDSVAYSMENDKVASVELQFTEFKKEI